MGKATVLKIRFLDNWVKKIYYSNSFGEAVTLNLKKHISNRIDLTEYPELGTRINKGHLMESHLPNFIKN